MFDKICGNYKFLQNIGIMTKISRKYFEIFVFF